MGSADGFSHDITLFVPAFNEAARIEATLRALNDLLTELNGPRAQILVVDDGSSDQTAEIVTRVAKEILAVELVRHPENRGLGSGLKTALAHAKGAKFLIVPGDNDMPATTLRVLISHAHQADMVMCFFLNREQRGRLRNALSTIFGMLYATAFDIYVEYINGPAVYAVAPLRELTLRSTRFSIVAEINVKLLRQGVTYLEVPSYRQTGLAGSSSFSFRNLREVGAIFASLLYEVHWKHRGRFNFRPTRVMVPFVIDQGPADANLPAS